MTHNQDKSSMLSQGIFIFVYLAVLTALEYFVAATFKSVAVLVVVALIKAALVVYYYMHIYKLNADHEGDHDSYEYKTGTNRLGLWLFLVSDLFVFGGLMVMRMNLLGLTRPNLNQLLGLGVTAILLISSFFMNRGETMMANGDRKGALAFYEALGRPDIPKPVRMAALHASRKANPRAEVTSETGGGNYHRAGRHETGGASANATGAIRARHQIPAGEGPEVMKPAAAVYS